jgi:hypothetical protein
MELWEGRNWCLGTAMHGIEGVYTYGSYYLMFMNLCLLTELFTRRRNQSVPMLIDNDCLCRVGRLQTAFNQLHSTLFWALVAILFERLTCTRLFYEWMDWSQNTPEWRITISKEAQVKWNNLKCVQCVSILDRNSDH